VATPEKDNSFSRLPPLGGRINSVASFISVSVLVNLGRAVQKLYYLPGREHPGAGGARGDLQGMCTSREMHT